MNWELAIEKNHGALKRILAMLVGLVGMAGGADADLGAGDRRSTLPRHLHRFVLRLLRPAEAATRRLIIVAARGLVVKLPKFREAKPRPKKPPLNRKNGYGTNIVIRPGPLPEWARALMPKRSTSRCLSLLDPMKRFGVRHKYAKPAVMPQIRVLGGDPIVPLFRRPEPTPPPTPTPDDPLDAGSIHRRLEALASALGDLPGQAQRMARWQARRDARLSAERSGDSEPPLSRPFAPPSVLPDISPTRGEISGGAEASDLPPCGGDVRQDRGGQRRAPNDERTAHCQSNATGKRRFHRLSPMRPGRPPGWRRKPNHDVYEVLNELHGLAVWARERRDSS